VTVVYFGEGGAESQRFAYCYERGANVWYYYTTGIRLCEVSAFSQTRSSLPDIPMERKSPLWLLPWRIPRHGTFTRTLDKHFAQENDDTDERESHSMSWFPNLTLIEPQATALF
jgi:hypothetical protein